MTRQRVTVDMEALMVGLLHHSLIASGEYPDRPVEVRAEADVDSADVLPLCIVSVGQGVMVSNGAPGLAWTYNVHINLLHDDEEEVSMLADHVYELMHGFHDSQSGIEGVGVIVSTEDVSMPTRTATVVTPAGDLTQFDGTWTVTAQKY